MTQKQEWLRAFRNEFVIEERMETAFDMGRDEYGGCRIMTKHNPFPEGTPEHAAYIRGWKDAEEADLHQEQYMADVERIARR